MTIFIISLSHKAFIICHHSEKSRSNIQSFKRTNVFGFHKNQMGKTIIYGRLKVATKVALRNFNHLKVSE